MAFWDIFRRSRSGLRNAYTTTGTVPFYSDFGNDVYASDIVRAAIECKTTEFKKLDLRHIRTVNGEQSVITDHSVSRILQQPNAWTTQADFLEKIKTIHELNKNVYIYPAYYRNVAGEKVYTGMYVLKPKNVWYKQDAANKLFIEFEFYNGYFVTLPANEVVHWRKNYGVDDYFGGFAYGGDDNAGLLKTLDVYDKLTQSIAKALRVSCQINGVMHINTYLDDDKSEARRKDFVKRLENNDSGILFEDEKAKYTHIPRDVKLVDAETLKYFRYVIAYSTGVSDAIMSGDYTPQQKQAFYERALEADIKSLGQAMTAVLFTPGEISHGNAVTAYPNKIIFMSMEHKIAYMNVAVPAGAMKKNEIRDMGGYAPIEGGDELPRAYNSLDNNTGGATQPTNGSGGGTNKNNNKGGAE